MLLLKKIKVMKKIIHCMIWLAGCIYGAIQLAGGADGGIIRCDGGATAMLIMAIAAAAISTGVAVRNSIAARKSKAAADRTIGGLNAENASNYYADYYRGALTSDSARAYLKRLDAAMGRQNRALDNSIVSTGATNENALAQRQAKNEVMGGAMAQAVAAEDARKDRTRQNYFNTKKNLTLAQMQADQNYENQKSANLSQIAGAISQAASAYGMYAGMGSGGTTGGGGWTAPDMNKAKGQINDVIKTKAYSGIDRWNAQQTAARQAELKARNYRPSVGVKTQAQLDADRLKKLGRV